MGELKEKISQTFFGAIDTSKFETPMYFTAIVLIDNGDGMLEPLYKKCTKEKYNSSILPKIPQGRITFISND